MRSDRRGRPLSAKAHRTATVQRIHRGEDIIYAQAHTGSPGTADHDRAVGAVAAAKAEDTAQLRQEVEQLKKTIATLEQRLSAQEKSAQQARRRRRKKDTVSVPELQANVKDLDERVRETERKSYLDRLNWSGDYRFEAHTIRGSIPTHYDGMQLQNLVVRTLWMMTPTHQGGLGLTFDPAMLQAFTPSPVQGLPRRPGRRQLWRLPVLHQQPDLQSPEAARWANSRRLCSSNSWAT